MTHRVPCLLAVLASGLALAPCANAQSSNDAPVAYAYVSTPLAVDGFAVAANGRLTPLPGSPFVGLAFTHMSVNSKYLFGAGQDGVNVYSYAMAADGSLSPADVVPARTYYDCEKLYGTQVDRTGSTLYLSQSGCTGGNDFNIQSYKISSSGTLQFLGNTLDDEPSQAPPSPLYFLANNKYAYQVACTTVPSYEGFLGGFERDSTGYLNFHSTEFDYPDFASHFCLNFLATDDFNNAAVELLAYNCCYTFDQAKIASFSADANGDMSSANGFNVRTLSLQDGEVSAMSISPSGKLLAVGGPHGFQLFHFNGAAPPGYYSQVLQPNNQFEEFGWDKSDHLFALSTDGLRVYNITPSAYSEAPGSPLEIPGASSVIVVSLQ